MDTPQPELRKISLNLLSVLPPRHRTGARVEPFISGASVTIKQYFGSAPRNSRSSSSMAPEELEQLTQQIRDQLKESITEKVTQQLMLSFSQM